MSATTVPRSDLASLRVEVARVLARVKPCSWCDEIATVGMVTFTHAVFGAWLDPACDTHAETHRHTYDVVVAP